MSGLPEMLKKPPLKADLINLLSPDMEPQYYQIGRGLRVNVDALGLLPLPNFNFQNLDTVLTQWVNNGNNPNNPDTHYAVTWGNIIKVVQNLNWQKAQDMRKFLERGDVKQRYS